MKKYKRECAVITAVDSESVTVCCLPADEKPSPTYIPLCAAHRAMAGVREIDVFAGKEVAIYRL